MLRAASSRTGERKEVTVLIADVAGSLAMAARLDPEDVHALIDLAPSLSKWALVRWDPIKNWSSGRVTLMGDAAHATLPFLAQGAVHSIEDGIVLARALESYGDAPDEALKRYEDARIDRTTRMVLGATANTGRFHAPELATEAGADAYILSHIIHDWSEDQCLTILGNVHRAMQPDGRVLIVEMVLPADDTPHPGKLLDIMMLVGPGGQERTTPEYEALLQKAGFRLNRVVSTASAVSLVEGVRA